MQTPPLKTLRLRLIFFKRVYGTGNFHQDSATHKPALILLLKWVNDNYFSQDTTSDSITGVIDVPLGNRKIQFSLGPVGQERIYYYQNTALWEGNCDVDRPALENAVWGTGPQADPTRKNYMNIFFTEGHVCGSVATYNISVVYQM